MRLSQGQIARIKALENKDGYLSAQRVLADAKKPTSPLHKLFNWNIKQAAERWWLHRARLIIGAVTIQVTHEHSVIKTPCYTVDPTVKEERYRAVVSLARDPVASREALLSTLEAAAGQLRRAYDLAGPLGMESEINELVHRITGLIRVTAKAAA